MLNKDSSINKNKPLTNEIVEQYEFVKVNHSMWRRDEFTLQNGSISDGNNLIEKIFSNRKAYKVCYKGKFLKMIENEEQLKELFHAYEIVINQLGESGKFRHLIVALGLKFPETDEEVKLFEEAAKDHVCQLNPEVIDPYKILAEIKEDGKKET